MEHETSPFHNLRQRLERHKQLVIALRGNPTLPLPDPDVEDVEEPDYEEPEFKETRRRQHERLKNRRARDYYHRASVPILDSQKGYPRNAVKGMLRRR